MYVKVLFVGTEIDIPTLQYKGYYIDDNGIFLECYLEREHITLLSRLLENNLLLIQHKTLHPIYAEYIFDYNTDTEKLFINPYVFNKGTTLPININGCKDAINKVQHIMPWSQNLRLFITSISFVPETTCVILHTANQCFVSHYDLAFFIKDNIDLLSCQFYLHIDMYEYKLSFDGKLFF